MKKKMISFISLLVLYALLPFAFADADGSINNKKDVFVFPCSLEAAGEEAFRGTAVRTVVFQEGFRSIGDFAFADAHNLTDVYIPSSTEYIGNNAFPSNKHLAIHGVIGSVAAKWAKEHQVPFVPSNIWSLLDDSGTMNSTNRILADSYCQEVASEKNNNLHGRTENEGRSMRPQERPELNPIDYRFP